MCNNVKVDGERGVMKDWWTVSVFIRDLEIHSCGRWCLTRVRGGVCTRKLLWELKFEFSVPYERYFFKLV